jgi:hypothetical protein
MRDHRAKDSHQEKRERAIGYLKERGIWRGCCDCDHQYKPAGLSSLPSRSVSVSKVLP